MKNIHLFETEAAYDAAKSGLILPRVSYIEETKVVDYNPHHDYVEIAGIKWATMNVGANKVTDYGLYFQWGDTKGYTADEVGTGEGKKKFAEDWSDYKWYDKENSTSDTPLFTKYNTKDNLTELALEDDAVHTAWGGSWRMPTKEEFAKLGDAVITGWTNDYQGSKVAGIICTAKNDGSKILFFPACGVAEYGSVKYIDSVCTYWSSSINSSYVSIAYGLLFVDGSSDIVIWQEGGDDNGRNNGFCVRGVLDEK